ncbi:dephospho-CoA kinase [Cytobacillus purgationiresistens]|uniref:Uncharacterized protein n=1 Tax=Cytobacillus purgationiresistens TaxID=863449 RepID=A0ABU0AHP5_9BACI|nr:dephospho-CoA kinase [Cytobacillus purgationiresistens]MDQ0270752.1 hypothetical protein [Cytobacillus purgationiresistens]
MKTEIEVNRTVTVTKIALCGKLRSGKDAVANRMYIRAMFDRVAFGDKLKYLYHATLPWVPEHPKPRAGYQTFGQDMRRLYGEDIWIRHVERTVEASINFRKTTSDHVGIVITDLRQPNELEWAKANGFTIVRVTALEADRLICAEMAGDEFDAKDLAHDTEQHVDGFTVDYEIVNDGTLDELHAKVDAMLDEIAQ